MKLLRKRTKPSLDRWDERTELAEWAPGASWTIGDAYKGTLITGGTGSGKSSGPIALTLDAMLRAGFAGVLHCAKPEDRDNYIASIQAAGRIDDLVLFTPDHRVRMNFLEDEVKASRTTLGLVENSPPPRMPETRPT